MNRKEIFRWTSIGWLALFLTLATGAFAKEVERQLAEMPAQVKEGTREIINGGLRSEEAIQLVQGMQGSRFSIEQMLKAHKIILEAQRKGLPARPAINKAFEGMAKQIPPEKTLQAMEAVCTRYEFAYGQARSLARDKEQFERLGNLLAESLAAGFSEQDASTTIRRLQEQSVNADPEQSPRLAAACLAMLRDMSRLGVSSDVSAQVISHALSQGYSAAEITGMHQSLVSQAQAHSPQSVAQGFAQSMQQGQTPQGSGSAPGGHSGSGSSGGAGGGSGGGGSGGSGGAGGGAGGGPGGGSGGGNR